MIYKGTDYIDITLEQDTYLTDGVEVFNVDVETEVHLEYADGDLSADNPDDYYGGITIERVKVLRAFVMNEHEEWVSLSKEDCFHIEQERQNYLCQQAAELTTWSKDDFGGY